MTGDPLRLLHDPTTAAVLRRDLGSAVHGVPYDVDAGLARFESNLAQGTGVATTAKLGASGGGSLAVGALLLVGGLAAVIGWSLAVPATGPGRAEPELVASAESLRSELMRPESLRPNAVEPTPRLLAPVVPLAPAVMPAEASLAPPAEVAAPAPVARPVKARRAKGTHDEVAAVDEAAPADYLREARDLNAARGHLGHDAAKALALAEAGAAEFKAGTFAQEWEGVAVLALFELGRVDEARARAELFLQRYPNGTYAPRIRQVLEPVAGATP